MVHRDAYESNSPSGPGGAFNILRLVGHSKHLSSGFVGFAIKTFSVSASASFMFGITSYMAFSKYLGPAMPFLVGMHPGVVRNPLCHVSSCCSILKPCCPIFHICREVPRLVSLGAWFTAT
ncbi:hypothetical protein Vafri_17756 [Volvox africanus]|uniref:Uncharacterized protein n=1 Tax=Volvox africanus TaxID=51714 RepID=A0A8J4BL24_9CHLO|nr:hypothetical protein Vafri_17756 [Volvox africanus]